MNAALIAGGTVANIIVLADDTHLTADLAGDLGGDTLVAVLDGTPCGPGWAYDPDSDPPFTAPATVDPPQPPPPAVDPVQAAFAAIGTIAAAAGPTLDEKLAAIVGVLAQNAPPTSPLGDAP